MAEIKVKICGEEKELSVKEAEELFNELKEVFGKEEKRDIQLVPYYPYVPYEPYIPPSIPYGPYKPWNPYDPYITWGTSYTTDKIELKPLK